MRVDVVGFAGKNLVAHITGDLTADELMDVTANPKAYLLAVHPQAKARKVDRAFAVIDCGVSEAA